MHVGDLDGGSANVKNNQWRASVTIVVHDSGHAPVVNAVVTGAWSGGASGSASCTTDGSGRCSVTTGTLSKNSSSVVFTVSGATHAALSYQAGDNHDSDGDSNGSRITVPRQ